MKSTPREHKEALDRHAKLIQHLIDEGYAVAYDGQAKEDIEAAHLENRERLISEGKIVLK